MVVLKRKYNYALTLLQAYADGINEKIKLLTYLKYEVLGFLPLYLFFIIINKLCLSDYDNPILLLYIYLIPDLLLEFAFAYLMRPKIVPEYYSLDLGDMFNATEKWHTQMQNESIKDTTKQITKITDAMHHSSEAWYKPDSKSAFALTAPIDIGESSENLEGYVDAISKTNSEFLVVINRFLRKEIFFSYIIVNRNARSLH